MPKMGYIYMFSKVITTKTGSDRNMRW